MSPISPVFSSIPISSGLTPSESRLLHSWSITPKRKKNPEATDLKKEIEAVAVKEEGGAMDTRVLMDVKQEPVDKEDPLDVDEEDPLDIKEDKETYPQRMEGHRDMASMVQVKLECATEEMEPEDPITGFSCPKYP